MDQELEINKTETEKITLKKANPAPEAEMKDFWKKLRHFYRTGEKPSGDERYLSSALLHLLENGDSPYPYILGNGEKAIVFEENAPFYFFDHLLSKHQKANKRAFKNQLSGLITGLNKLLHINDKSAETAELKGTYDFADEMIAFDKMADLMSSETKEEFSEERLNRLTNVFSTLQEGLKSFNEQEGIIVLNKELREKFETGFDSKVRIIDARQDSFTQVQKLISDQMKAFTTLIKAVRIAKLEIEDNYQKDIHDEYFDHFTRYRLLQDELNLFHPIIMLVDQQYLFKNLASFSSLMATNQPVNVVVLNHQLISAPDQQVSWEDASHQVRQELAALAIAHRNVYTFQGTMDDPSAIYNGLENCLRSSFPGICHLSVPKDETVFAANPAIIAKAENAGRYFPGIMYDPGKVSEWGGRFDLSNNDQPAEKWPVYKLKAYTSEGTEELMDVAFTYADYKAIYPEKVKELMVIPEDYYTEHLIPLADYLSLEEEKLYGKIPYIWLIDEKHELYRAAVPNVWVVSCQERLDLWLYLQELGGINSYHVKAATLQKDQELAKLLEEQKAKLEGEHEQQIAVVQEKATTRAVEQMITALLDENMQLEDLLNAPAEKIETKISTSPAEKPVQEKAEPKEEPKEEPVAETPPPVSEKPWVEMEECTSCNDCTDKYPHLFKYNEDKQAYIDDPTKGTYEELVKAAENCPAACIHPGLPLNPKEPNLEKLIRRGEKFN
ncbi:MAG: ferredoxin [Candidatus Cyclobacteriaceae bacterium M2_1C_046]